MSDQELVQASPRSVAPAVSSFAAIPQQYASPGISLTQLWAIVRAYRRVSLISLGIAFLLAVSVVILLPKSYEATATLMVDYEVNDPLGGKEFPIGLLGSYMSTQIQLMQSPVVLAPVIDKLGLPQDPELAESFKGDPSLLKEWIMTQFGKNLAVEQGGWGSQLINITYTADSPKGAADAANAVADVYTAQQILRLTGPASERAQRYSKQLEELKQDVQTAQDALTAYRQKTGLVETDGRANLDMDRLGRLEGQLLAAQEQRRMAESRTQGQLSTRDSVLGANSIQKLKGELAEQQAKLAELRATVGARHPEAMELQSKIDSTQKAIDSEMSIYSGNSQVQVDTARALERQLEQAVAAERQRALGTRKTLDEAAKYEGDLATAQRLYSSALNGYDQIMMSSGSSYNNVRLISRAMPPVNSGKPKAAIKLAVMIMMLGMMGVAGPLVYELFNRRVRCRDDIDRDFGIPVLAEFVATPRLGGSA